MLRPWSDSIPPTPSMTKLPPPIRAARRRVALPRRRSRRRAAPSFAPTNPLLEQAFPSWARPPKQPAVGADAGFDAAFFAGAGLALLDQILRLDPPFAGALRQRLALRAATACAALARHREDSSALRDAEHLSPNAGGTRPPAPPGASIGCGACSRPRPTRLDAPTLRIAADLLGLDGRHELRGARRRLAGHRRPAPKHPLAAAAGASAAAMKLFRATRTRVDAEIFALWLADLALARRLGWDAPVPLLATAIAHPSSRRGAGRQASASGRCGLGRTPWPAPMRWPPERLSPWRASCRAVRKRCWRPSPNCAPRAPGGSIELLLADDAVSPARAAKLARLSDRAAAGCSIG